MTFDPALKVKVQSDTSGFEKSLEQRRVNTEAFGRVFTTTIRQAALSGKSFDDVLRNLGTRLTSMALSQAFKPLENLFSGFIGNLVGGILPGTGSSGPSSSGIVPFAKGGVVASLSYFQHGAGLGLMGEQGAEAIMPLKRGSDGKLGVASGGSTNPVNIVFNVQATDAGSFRKSESQMTTMLARVVARGQRGL